VEEAGAPFRRDIEGLRAIAVAAVVLYHAGTPHFGGGYVGVDVFFVISGFLITGQLLRDDRRAPTARIRHFYARRLRRIVPAATLVIITTLVAAALWQSPLLTGTTRDDARSAMFFVSNIRFARATVDYFSLGRAPSLFQHFWSLSLEEQFYFVWPALLVGISAVTKSRRNTAIVVTMAVTAAASFAACVLVTATRAPYAFFLLPFRAWELIAGAGLYVLTSRLGPGRRRGAPLMAYAGLALVALAITSLSDTTPYPGAIGLLPVAGTLLVIFAGSGTAAPPRLLASNVFQLGGRYSYSIYLWHWPVLTLLTLRYPDRFDSWPRALLGVSLVALPASVASYHLVENPFRHSFNRRADRQSIAAGLGLIAVSAFALVPFGAIGRGPLDSGRAAMTAPNPSPDAPTAFVPSNLRPTLRRASNSIGGRDLVRCLSKHDCVTGRASARRTVVLYGDSHAGHWVGAFAPMGRANGWRVEVMSFGGCRSYRQPNPPSGFDCERFRAESNARIAQLRPGLVVFSNQSISFFRQDRGAWERGIAAAIDAVPAGTNVAVLSETPIAPANVPVCLSLHLQDTRACEPHRPSPKFDAFNAALRAVVTAHGATFVDLMPWVCTDSRCPVVMGDVLVYRDPNHLTATFTRTRADAMAEALRPLMP
jgi:peptidoglycan/LPS O-acetylase OafA/YrhL